MDTHWGDFFGVLWVDPVYGGEGMEWGSVSLYNTFRTPFYWACSGCSRGRVAIRVMALWQNFNTLTSIGSSEA
jgi:hypothetical protein